MEISISTGAKIKQLFSKQQNLKNKYCSRTKYLQKFQKYQKKF